MVSRRGREGCVVRLTTEADSVARTDMAVALPLLAQRMPDAGPEGPGDWLPVSGNTGAVRFPIRFTPPTYAT